MYADWSIMVRSQFDERCALVLAPAPEGQLTHAHTFAGNVQ